MQILANGNRDDLYLYPINILVHMHKYGLYKMYTFVWFWSVNFSKTIILFNRQITHRNENISRKLGGLSDVCARFDAPQCQHYCWNIKKYSGEFSNNVQTIRKWAVVIVCWIPAKIETFQFSNSRTVQTVCDKYSENLISIHNWIFDVNINDFENSESLCKRLDKKNQMKMK